MKTIKDLIFQIGKYTTQRDTNPIVAFKHYHRLQKSVEIDVDAFKDIEYLDDVLDFDLFHKGHIPFKDILFVTDLSEEIVVAGLFIDVTNPSKSSKDYELHIIDITDNKELTLEGHLSIKAVPGEDVRFEYISAFSNKRSNEPLSLKTEKEKRLFKELIENTEDIERDEEKLKGLYENLSISYMQQFWVAMSYMNSLTTEEYDILSPVLIDNISVEKTGDEVKKVILKSTEKLHKFKLINPRQSPRQHLRRGHPRRYKNGKVIWINSQMIGDPSKGVITHIYEVDKTPASKNNLIAKIKKWLQRFNIVNEHTPAIPR